MGRSKELGPGLIKLSQNVVIKEKGSTIKCDEAIHNTKTDMVDAYGNVKIYRAGSEFPITGDKLFYDGSTSIARLRENVHYQDSTVSFNTEKFNYNATTEEGFYFDGGIVKDSANTLISKRGYVYKNNDIIVKDDVVITTPDYLVLSDSVKYNSNNNTVYIIAPTTMYSDSSVLYTEGGYYDTKANYAYLTKNSKLTEGSYSVLADTISYNENTMIGRAFGNIVMDDTLQQMMLRGNHGYHDGITDYSMMTDSATMLMYAGFDTLFAHADTFEMFKDTADLQFVTGYANVRFFRIDVQGKCDSLVYSIADSMATMYHQPMLWAIFNQMEGEIINIYNKNNTISHVEMVDDAFLASREDSIRFNQVIGKTITGYIRGNELSKIKVDGAAESIYYSREGTSLVGYNKTESTDLSINMKNSQVTKLTLSPASSGNFRSMESVPHEEQFLRGFQWRSDLRPTSPEDIYRRTPPEDKKKKRKKK